MSRAPQHRQAHGQKAGHDDDPVAGCGRAGVLKQRTQSGPEWRVGRWREYRQQDTDSCRRQVGRGKKSAIRHRVGPMPVLGGPDAPRPGKPGSGLDNPGFQEDALTWFNVLVLTLDRLQTVSNECC